MSDKREEIVGGDTMMVDLAGVGAAVEIASNIEVPTEPIEDSGVVMEMDDAKAKKKRKRKMKHVDHIHSQIEQQDSEDDSKKGQPTSGEGMPLPLSTAPTSWGGLQNFLPLKLMQSMAGQTQATTSEGQSNATNAKSGEGGKMPFPSFPSYYTPYGPMAFIPVPLMPGFQQDGKSMWSQALAQKFPMIFHPNKMSQKNSSPSGDSGEMTADATKQSPKKDSAMEEELEDDKPIRTSVITAGAPFKKTKQKQDTTVSKDPKLPDKQAKVSLPTTTTATLPMPEDSGNVEDDIQQPSSPASSDNSTSTNTSGPHDVLLRVSEAHIFLLQDEDGDTPLHLAVIHERLDLVRKMVKTISGVFMNLDIANHMRQTPLHLAVITQQPLMVETLVKGGASVNFPDRKGNTCIHLASQRRDLKSLKELSKATSPLPDYNAKNFQGLTPVHTATQESSKDVLKFLFDSGANKNSADTTCGRTALHYAVEQENVQLVNFLIQEGCDTNASTFSGELRTYFVHGMVCVQ
jgi:ankyrin repeat protein